MARGQTQSRGYILRKLEKKIRDRPVAGIEHTRRFSRWEQWVPSHRQLTIPQEVLRSLLTAAGHETEIAVSPTDSYVVLRVFKPGEPYARCIVRGHFDIMSPFIMPGRGAKTYSYNRRSHEERTPEAAAIAVDRLMQLELPVTAQVELLQQYMGQTQSYDHSATGRDYSTRAAYDGFFRAEYGEGQIGARLVQHAVEGGVSFTPDEQEKLRGLWEKLAWMHAHHRYTQLPTVFVRGCLYDGLPRVYVQAGARVAMMPPPEFLQGHIAVLDMEAAGREADAKAFHLTDVGGYYCLEGEHAQMRTYAFRLCKAEYNAVEEMIDAHNRACSDGGDPARGPDA